MKLSAAADRIVAESGKPPQACERTPLISKTTTGADSSKKANELTA